MKEPGEIRIVFMGTPDFAVSSLAALKEAGYRIPAVVTAPDRPAGRGQKLKVSAVKDYALSQNLPLLQPEKLKDPSFIAALKDLAPDLMIVVAFRMLPREVWSIPSLGTFNLHASLLPQYRGAAPIQWAVMNGETESGLTTFLIDDRIDTGRILLQQKISIGDDETAGELHDRMQEAGSQLVVKTCEQLMNGSVEPFAQAEESVNLKPAPKIFREHCRINWADTAGAIHNKVRGLNPVPGAFSKLKTRGTEQEIKIYKTRYATGIAGMDPGNTRITEEGKLLIAALDGWVELLEVQPSGKRKMAVADWLRGLNLDDDAMKFE